MSAKKATFDPRKHDSKLVFAGKRSVDPRIVAKVRGKSKFYDDRLAARQELDSILHKKAAE
ncbi:hypothetical protein [Oleomonas cavernae]|uniref:hypothetical protein n=1 Tax=Oleomonas cavernae TaxID=2320859 RepID=UPI0011C47D2F|nr:hypothetical protein [Oleomonas cavernae]